MNMTWSLDSKTLVSANKSWRNALHGARERIRDAQIHSAPQPQPSNAEILSAALRVRDEFKAVRGSNEQMRQALADFKNRRRRMCCERGLSGPGAFAQAPRS